MFPIRDHNPSERVAFVTYSLMAINIGIWIYGALYLTSDAALNRLYSDYAMIPAKVTAGDGLSGLFTSIFLHAGFLHLAGNMLFLFIFGDNMEDEMGHIPFLIFYITCGVAASLGQWLAGPYSPVATVGASGAIAGVMGGYLLLFPRAKVDVLLVLIIIIRIIPIPAWVVLGMWFAIQLFNGYGSDISGGGVAYWAHIGGFVAGLALTIPLWVRRGAMRFWVRTDGHPPHPEARYPIVQTRIPRVRRR